MKEKGKRVVKSILAFVMVLVVGMALVGCAKPTANEEEILYSETVEMGENAYMKIVETASRRTTEYYVDGKLTQKAVYDLESGKIVSYDYSQGEEPVVTTYDSTDFTE